MGTVLSSGFLLKQLVQLVCLCSVQYLNGWLVEHKSVRVNYTRKINHFVLFLVPICLGWSFALEQSFGLFALGAMLAVAKFGFYVLPVRKRIGFINMMFKSFDRPEDRPHTLKWIASQTACGYAVLIPMGVLYAYHGYMELFLIPLLIYGIGDGLAEPVGVRFGKHSYSVPGLFTERKYVRTLEGSACVLITGLVVTAVHYPFFTTVQFITAMLVIPLFMTVAEAISPHTWDSPLMFLVGYLALFAVTFI